MTKYTIQCMDGWEQEHYYAWSVPCNAILTHGSTLIKYEVVRSHFFYTETSVGLMYHLNVWLLGGQVYDLIWSGIWILKQALIILTILVLHIAMCMCTKCWSIMMTVYFPIKVFSKQHYQLLYTCSVSEMHQWIITASKTSYIVPNIFTFSSTT